MSQQTLVIPDSAKCARCGIEAKTQMSVFDLFGIRKMDNQLRTQSHCKKCRKLHLSKELREKLNQFKDSIEKKYAKTLKDIQTNFKQAFENLRDSHKKDVEKILQNKKIRQDSVLEKKKSEIETKRIELEGKPS